MNGNEIFNLASAVDLAAKRWNDRIVLYHYETGKTVTFGEVPGMVNRVGNAIRKTGVEIENRVAILMDDCPEWVYILFGTLKIGAVLTPLNPLLIEKDYSFFLSDSRAKMLFIDASYFNKIKGIISSLPYLKQVIVFNGVDIPEKDERVISWDNFIGAASEELDIEPTLPTDVALFAYTSGSTGRPRAIMHSHRTTFLGSSYFQEVNGVDEGHIQFHVPKLYFAVSFEGLISSFYNGSSVVLLSGRPTPLTVLKVMAKYMPTFLNAPPTFLARLVEYYNNEAQSSVDMSSIRYIFCAGETLSPELFKRFKETFGLTICNNWGSQEITAAPLSWPFGEEVPFEKVGSSGKSPCMGAQVKIVDENGNEVANGVSGEIMVKTKSMFLGYWHEPEETVKKIDRGWYRPGDSFIRDEDGYYWFLGRLDDMVKIGGRQVFPAEIENTIALHPAVLENAIIVVSNDLGLNEIKAFIILKEGYIPSPEMASQIKDLVKDQLAPFKRPHYVEFVSDLPKTATGKIQRFRLKQQVLDKKN